MWNRLKNGGTGGRPRLLSGWAAFLHYDSDEETDNLCLCILLCSCDSSSALVPISCLLK